MGTDSEFLHKEPSETIIGCAMRVLNALKPGLDEKIYERALVIALRKPGRITEQQCVFPVFFEGERIGALIPDLIVSGQVIADPKVVSEFNESHIARMIGHLSITGLRVALLLDFRYAQLRWKRIVR
ncbi:MAG: GxxExxY protein [Opitutaceae bacterium]